MDFSQLSSIQLPSGPNVDWSEALAYIKAEKLRRQAGIDVKPPHTLVDEPWPPDYDQVYLWRKKKLAQIESGDVDISAMRNVYATTGWRGAVKFITHWMDVYEPRNAGTDKPVWMPMVLFPKQVELVQFVFSCLEGNESGLVEKSRTMGATWVCVNLSIWMWLFWTGAAIGWGSQSQEQVDRIGDMSSLFEKLRQSIVRLPDIWKPKQVVPDIHLLSRRLINPETGSTIVGEIGDKIGRGGRTRVFFLDEFAHLERPDTVEAAVGETSRVRIYISSVNGVGNLFHRKREAGVDWSPENKDKIEKGKTRVFVMDWSDHPEYDWNWYTTKKKNAEDQGIRHVFASEIERNYSASVEGIIIRSEYVEAAVDAHLVLGIEEDGGVIAALDVADQGLDRNAFAGRRSIILKMLEEWGDRDVGRAARRTVELAEKLMRDAGMRGVEVNYDGVGLGAGVRAEVNRLEEERLMPKGMIFLPWLASAAVLNPVERQIPLDDQSPMNKHIFENLKAQGWWQLERRFALTYRAVMHARGTPIEGDEKGVRWTPNEIISLSSKLKLLTKLKKELSQPVWTRSSRLRMMVDKTPEGSASPNLSDSVMMVYWPVPSLTAPFAAPIVI